ncbi:MAG: hypothetical protein H6Q71_2039 [Firmicutes bacterium]|nr:hypothetical protein [Bacillota bacterium]
MECKLSDLTKASLEAINDDDVEYELYFYILTKLIGDNYDKQYDIVTKLPNGLRYSFASLQLENEVFNGGFNQYFYNTGGEFIDEAIAAFNYFGLPKLAEVVIKAADIALEEIELHINTKKKGTLEAFSDSYKYTTLGEADKEFYEHDKSISPARIEKIRKHVKDFLIG